MEVLLKDGDAFIAERQQRGNDRFDEVHHGTYVAMNAPSGDHQRIVTQLILMLTPLGWETYPGVNIGTPKNFREPDIAAWPGRAPTGVTWHEGADVPPLVVEVVSPSNSGEEMAARRQHYANAGVRVYAEIAVDGTVSVAAFTEDPTERETTAIAALADTRFDARPKHPGG